MEWMVRNGEKDHLEPITKIWSNEIKKWLERENLLLQFKRHEIANVWWWWSLVSKKEARRRRKRSPSTLATHCLILHSVTHKIRPERETYGKRRTERSHLSSSSFFIKKKKKKREKKEWRRRKMNSFSDTNFITNNQTRVILSLLFSRLFLSHEPLPFRLTLWIKDSSPFHLLISSDSSFILFLHVSRRQNVARITHKFV